LALGSSRLAEIGQPPFQQNNEMNTQKFNANLFKQRIGARRAPQGTSIPFF
jgi:hypothetical protein